VTNRKSEKVIAAFVPNMLGISPGQRVRIELWAKALEDAGWRIDFYPFEDEPLHEYLYTSGNAGEKVRGLVRCYKKQFRNINKTIRTDIAFIFREASLVGPAILERLIARKGVPVVFDLDDPIFLPYKSPINNWASLLKFSRKTHKIFKISSQIIAINQLIADYARQFNPNVTVIPNCIDTERYVPGNEISRSRQTPKLIWIGSQSTMTNLNEIAAPLRRLEESHNAELLIIGAGKADLGLRNVEFRQWSAESEVTDLQEGGIGLLPLTDLNWNNWKFFFKAIQYMAVGIPVVARRMGSNVEVIKDGINGYLVETEDEWYDRIGVLLRDEPMRRRMGNAARQTVESEFSLSAQAVRVVDLFEDVRRSARVARDAA
jgi:glycosyltransferase involved in cell wall biosynthesis